MGSTTNRSRFGASARRKFMANQVVPTTRELKDQAYGMQPVLRVGQKVKNGQIEVRYKLSQNFVGCSDSYRHKLPGLPQGLRDVVCFASNLR